VADITQFPRQFNRSIREKLDARFLTIFLLSLIVNVMVVYYMSERWEAPRFLDWTSEDVLEEFAGVELRVEDMLPRPLGGAPTEFVVREAGEGVGEPGPAGPKRVNRASIGGGKRYAGHEVAFMAPRGGAAEAGRARKEFAPMIGASKGYAFEPGQLSVHTEAGALPALASVRKGPAEIYQAGGLKSVHGVFAFTDEEGAIGLSGTMEIGVTTRIPEEAEVGGGTGRNYQSIYGVVSGNRGEIFYCLHSERKRDISLKGNIEMEVTLNQAGQVINVVFTEKTWWSNVASGKRVEQCIRNIIEGWNFGFSDSMDPSSRTTFNLSFLWT
jgi:hypothetical protein